MSKLHVGFALEVIDENEAQTIFKFLEHMNELDDLKIAADSDHLILAPVPTPL